MPGIGRRGNGPIRSREDLQNVLFERSSILSPLDAGPEFLGNYRTEVFERSESRCEIAEALRLRRGPGTPG